MLISLSTIHFYQFSLSMYHWFFNSISKYQGMLFSSSLTWSYHITYISSKTHKLLGFLYHHFYCHSDTFSPLRLYTSLIRPHLETYSFLWDTQFLTSCLVLKKIQFFASKLCHHWSSDYPTFLSKLHHPSLSSCCCKAKHIFFFKLFHNNV